MEIIKYLKQNTDKKFFSNCWCQAAKQLLLRAERSNLMACFGAWHTTIFCIIQAYVFSLLTAMYIGGAIQEHI